MVTTVNPLTVSVSVSWFLSCLMFSSCSLLLSWCLSNSAFISSTCCWNTDSCCLAWKRSAAVLLWLVFRKVSPACSCDETTVNKYVKIRTSEYNNKALEDSHLLELNLQLLALFCQFQKLFHDLIFLLSSLLEVGCELGDDAISLL